MRPLPTASIELLEQRLNLSTYYVSTAGSDSGPGTSMAPWKSLQKAADMAAAGDTVHVLAGTYNVGMNLYGKTGGTSTKPISFLADSGVTITHCASSGVNASAAAINIESTGGWYIVQGFTIVSDGSMQKAGIRVAVSSNCQILNNTVQRAFTGIFTSNADNLLIQGNSCSSSTDQHGIYMSANEHNCIVRGNTLFSNNWDGLHMNALNGSPNDGALVENNVIYGNNLSGMDIEGVTNAIFRNNIVYNNSKHGMTLHNQDQSNTPPCTGNLFVNNTITGNGLFGIQMAAGGNTANTIFNNILYSASSTYGSIGVSGAPTGLVSDYNVVVDNFSTNLGVSKITLAQWRAQTGQDQHSIIASASQLFVSPGSNDYHLKSGSPAIDAGTASVNGKNAPAMDFEGNSRPQGTTWDAGAYEKVTLTPHVVSAGYAWQSAFNQLTFTFNEDVSASLSPSSVSVTVSGSSSSFPASGFSWNATALTATFTLPMPLADGNYMATLNGSTTKDNAGNSLGSDYNLPFWVLMGDANRDQTVNAIDFNTLAIHFGKTGTATIADGDFNYDGSVNSSDFVALASRFGQTVSAPAMAVSAFAAPIAAAGPIGSVFSNTAIGEGGNELGGADRDLLLPALVASLKIL